MIKCDGALGRGPTNELASSGSLALGAWQSLQGDPGPGRLLSGLIFEKPSNSVLA